MTSVAVSPKYQIVIPKVLREAIKLRPGQRVELSLDGLGRLVVEPELDIRAARGFLPAVPGVDVSDVPSDPEGPDWPGGCDPLPDAPWIRPANRSPAK